jgi:hypothetical protein
MKTLLTLTVLVLVSCGNKIKVDNITHDTKPTSNSKLTDKLVGEWTLHPSCDGSIMCNVCAKMFFKLGTLTTTAPDLGTVENSVWEIKNDRLKITNNDNDESISTGEYKMTFEDNEDYVALILVDIKTSGCYKLSRPTSNWR